jgi:hypothetical protein
MAAIQLKGFRIEGSLGIDNTRAISLMLCQTVSQNQGRFFDEAVSLLKYCPRILPLSPKISPKG